MADKDVKTQMQELLDKGDFVGLQKLANEQGKAQREADKAMLAAKEGEINALAHKVSEDFQKLVNKYKDEIVALVGHDKAQLYGSWSSADGYKLIGIVSAKRASTGGGGSTTQKYEKSSEELLKTFGELTFQVDGKDSEQTLQEAYNSSTDGNFRFKVRKQLIKHDLQG